MTSHISPDEDDALWGQPHSERFSEATQAELVKALEAAERALSEAQRNVAGTDDLSDEDAKDTAYHDALSVTRAALATLAKAKQP